MDCLWGDVFSVETCSGWARFVSRSMPTVNPYFYGFTRALPVRYNPARLHGVNLIKNAP